MKKWLIDNSTLLNSCPSIIQIILFPLILVGIIASYIQVKQYLEKPNLHLIFSQPKELLFSIENTSKVTAEQPLYGFLLLDLDSKPVEPAPVPWREISYIHGNGLLGPNEFMKLYGKNGHRYFGAAMIQCKNCDREKTYWLYFIHGSNNNAWYTELKANDPNIWNSTALIIQNPDKYIKTYFPENRRQPIK